MLTRKPKGRKPREVYALQLTVATKEALLYLLSTYGACGSWNKITDDVEEYINGVPQR